MKFILGKKLSISQMFDEKGNAIPVTVIEAGPCYVTQIRTKDKDGYEAVQIGFGIAKKISKPRKGHLNKIKNEQVPREREEQVPRKREQKLKVKNLKYLKEFKADEKYELGQEIKADIFKEGDVVKVSGISKGKGFAGVVKRHGFRGAPATHGTKHTLRAPGSIGSSFPERVRKGTRMAGRMGSERVTIKNLEIAAVDAENNLLAIKGAVPGNRGALIEIRG